MAEFRLPKYLVNWADNSMESGSNILATSNQGTVLLFNEGGVEFVLKTAMGQGAVKHARQTTLLREHKAYQRLEGLHGVPKCHGMIDDRYLVLQYVHGIPYREAEIRDRDKWFSELRDIIRGFHQRGVAHGDLKSKDNLMMNRQGKPFVIDFGTTVLLKTGIHPINNKMFDYARQLDINAWVKHKYKGCYEDASPEDQALLHHSAIERWLRKYRAWRG